MPNTARLAILEALFLVQDAITLVQLALNDNPAPDDRLALEDLLTDLQTAKDELTRMRDQSNSGDITVTPPGDDLLDAIGDLTKQVEQARIDGAAAQAAMGAARQVLELGISVMSLAK